MSQTQTVFLTAGDVIVKTKKVVASVTAAEDHKFRTVTFEDGSVETLKATAWVNVTDKWAAYRKAAAQKTLERVLTETGEFFHFSFDGIATICGKVVDTDRDEPEGETYYCLNCQKGA
jgi:hypothetical protein